MIANISVITDNLDYLLWGRIAEGQPGGVLLTLLMAIGAAALALPAGIALACCAWRFPGAIRKGLFIWAEFIRGIPLIFVIFWMWYLLPMLTGSDLPGAITVTLALAWFTAASVMHSVYAGITALPGGQYDAAIVQGFRPLQALGLILLPQVLRNVLPSLTGILSGCSRTRRWRLSSTCLNSRRLRVRLTAGCKFTRLPFLSLPDWSITCCVLAWRRSLSVGSR